MDEFILVDIIFKNVISLQAAKTQRFPLITIVKLVTTLPFAIQSYGGWLNTV